jgi:hypothetical protein
MQRVFDKPNQFPHAHAALADQVARPHASLIHSAKIWEVGVGSILHAPQCDVLDLQCILSL